MMLEAEREHIFLPEEAPTLNYRIQTVTGGTYHIWLLMKFNDDRSDSCMLGLDGMVQPLYRQFSGGNMFTYSMKQRWHWRHVSDLDIPTGVHTFTILGRKSGLRIDRIYITCGIEWPPVDQDWVL